MAITTFDEIVKKAAPKSRTIKYGISVTESYVHDGVSYIIDGDHGFLYTPISECDRGEIGSFFTDDYLQRIRALENAELYRMGIIDEDIPDEYGDCSELLLNNDVYFCRQHMIHMLGEIGYYPACVELREAMLHDLNGFIRGDAAEALGKIGDKNYSNDLLEIAKDKSNPIHNSALRALGKMKDESTLPALKGMLDEEIRTYHLGVFTRDRDLVWKGMNDIQRIIIALRKFGGKANDIILETAQDDDFWLNWSIGKGIEYSRID